MSSVTLVLLRHGERADEAGSSSDSLNPPLTAQGIRQGGEAFESILESCPKNFLVFSSPLTRTLQTSSTIPSRDGSHTVPNASTVYADHDKISVLPGLASCALAIQNRGGIHHPSFAPILSTAVAVGNAIPSPSPLRFVPASSYHDATETFNAALRRAAEAAAGHESRTSVCVTHREGIRDVHAMLKPGVGRLSTPYCCWFKVTVPVSERGVKGMKEWVWEEEEEAAVAAPPPSVEAAAPVPQPVPQPVPRPVSQPVSQPVDEGAQVRQNAPPVD